ncbi:MAG TPA: PHB depolymerase family esterase [Pilimelia sp.]|nr:PHB depolymerase family esterase [Pilimelia sp.]
MPAPFRGWVRYVAGALVPALLGLSATAPSPAEAPAPLALSAVGGTTFAGVHVTVWGTRAFHGYVPSTYRPGRPVPLLVALHGCAEYLGHLEELSGLTALAEQRGFIVVYPEQNVLANPAKCWNWFLETNQHRGVGEPSIIAGITDRVRSGYAVDPRRIFVTGPSAGGVMANIMAVTYPDVFAAAAILAGCEYSCDVTRLTAPQAQGDKAYDEMGNRARPVPVIIFQGTADLVVPPVTAERLLHQWVRANDLAADGVADGDIDAVADLTVPGQVPGGRSYTRSVYRTADGRDLIETVIIDGAGHAWPGGQGPLGDPAGPDASAMQWDFFTAHPRP